MSGIEKRSKVSDLDIPVLSTSVMKGKLDALSVRLDILKRRIKADISPDKNAKAEDVTFEVVRDAVYRFKKPGCWPVDDDKSFADLLCTSNVCFVDGYLPVILRCQSLD